MRKKDVVVGNVYMMKVSNRIVPVRLDSEATYGGGWHGTNLNTNRKVRIRTAGKLRSAVGGDK